MLSYEDFRRYEDDPVRLTTSYLDSGHKNIFLVYKNGHVFSVTHITGGSNILGWCIYPVNFDTPSVLMPYKKEARDELGLCMGVPEGIFRLTLLGQGEFDSRSTYRINCFDNNIHRVSRTSNIIRSPATHDD